MDRRDWLKYIGASAGALGAGLLLPRSVRGQRRSVKHAENVAKGHFGWVPRPEETEKFIKSTAKPFFRDYGGDIKGSGEGKKALWWRTYEKITKGEWIPHNQGIGDCVSHGFGGAIDTLTTVQVETRRPRPEKWMGKCCTEWLYGGGRCEIGDQYGRYSDGSTGVWQAEFVQEFGVLLRKVYPGGFDFREYDSKRAKEYGAKGAPDPLEGVSREHPVKTAALVTTWEETRDAIYNGHLVAVCSNAGFGNGSTTRDSEGFLRRRRSPWYHCMFFMGMDDESGRPGALCMNSWGVNWIGGPTRHGQPPGSFWIDAETVDYMVRQQDSFALSNYVGYPSVVIPPYVIW